MFYLRLHQLYIWAGNASLSPGDTIFALPNSSGHCLLPSAKRLSARAANLLRITNDDFWAVLVSDYVAPNLHPLTL